MIAQELEVILHQAFVEARAAGHEHITAEHLLLALLGSPAVSELLNGCGADVAELGGSLSRHIGQMDRPIVDGHDIDTQPNLAFQRVIQRAILQVQTDREKAVGSRDVLMALFSEPRSYAAQLLDRQGLTRRQIAEGMNRATEPAVAPQIAASEPAPAPGTGGAIARELEATLHMAFVSARQQRHEVITVEHLLLALVDDPISGKVLQVCAADLEGLRRNLTEHIAKTTPIFPVEREVDTQPSLAFQRVLQRAILHAHATGREVTAANVLVAVFGEHDSHAVRMLRSEGVDRLKVVTFVSHGAVSSARTADLHDATEVQVVLYNDDFTPMEFVMRVLREFFGMDEEDAKETMLEIDRDGAAVCGLYARDDGAALVDQVLALAEKHGHPLMCEAVAPKQAD